MEFQQCCERCHEVLKPATIVWLEFDQRAGLYREPGTVPEEDSLGCFPFGKHCAKLAIQGDHGQFA